MTFALEIDPTVQVVEFRTQENSGLIAVASDRPQLIWQATTTRSDAVQTGFEIQRSETPAFAPSHSGSFRFEGSACSAAWPGDPLESREVTWCRIRLLTECGVTTWSNPIKIEGSLFDDACWAAHPIFLPSSTKTLVQVPPSCLRKEFDVREGLSSARLYVTSMGIHDTKINGMPVSQDLFEPGWTNYGERLLYASYDVVDILVLGRNAIATTVADGWWRGNLTWLPKRAVYGDATGYLAQIELKYEDGTIETVCTDVSWRGSTGEVLEADFYNGCTLDTALPTAGWCDAGFDDEDWEPVGISAWPSGLYQRAMPAVRVIDSREVELTRTGSVVQVDCGQNLTGWLQLVVRCEAPVIVTVRHAEVLEPNGNLHLSSLRTAKATDSYRLPPGEHRLEPQFTYHGFRFAEVELEGNAELTDCKAQVVSSDLRRIGQFRCSDRRVNQLYENIIWSQRGNFISIPTDCPQRDERLGWTGDIQVFAPTACTNFDCGSFLSSWLTDLAIDQRADGNVTSTVPNVIWGHPFEFAGVGWGDAATLVPWAIYEAYGDATVLDRQFASMKAWVDYGLSRRGADGTWSGDFHLGDWLDPAAPAGHPELATTDRDFIATSYLVLSTRTLGKSAERLGKPSEATRYLCLAADIANAAWRKWQAQAPLTQTGCAMAIVFGIAPLEQHAHLGSCLARLVLSGKGIGTGFLGTPLVLPALTQTGHFEAAATLLLDDEHPGWLYQVRHGATTVWERWDAIRSDGSIHTGDLVADDSPGMMSFNHYAYGSIGAWLYRDLAGIGPARPGYEAIAFSPCPLPGITWAEASVETPRGRAAIAWRMEGATMKVECDIPWGVTAELRVPAGWHNQAGPVLPLGAGSHAFTLEKERA